MLFISRVTATFVSHNRLRSESNRHIKSKVYKVTTDTSEKHILTYRP